MTKVTVERVARSAVVHVRQSTAYQVTNNLESGRWQYGLVKRARRLGWDDIEVIDDDLGRSRGGIARPGFEKLPLHHILTNPVYAGAYAFGRRGAQVTIAGGRKHVIRSLRRKPGEWEVLIKDHHEGYITWLEFERNQELISDNANGKSYRGRRSVRNAARFYQVFADALVDKI